MEHEIQMTPASRRRWSQASFATALVLLIAATTIAWRRENASRVEKERQLAEVSALYETAQARIAEADEKLLRAESHYKSVTARMSAYVAFIEDSGYPVVILRSSGEIIEWNAGAEKDTGYSFAEIQSIGRGILPIIPPEMQGEHAMHSAAAFANRSLLGKIQNVECDRVRKPAEGETVGKRRRVRVSVRMFQDGDETLAFATWAPISKIEELQVNPAGEVTEKDR